MNHSFQVFNYFTTILPPRSQDKTGISSFFLKNSPSESLPGATLKFSQNSAIILPINSMEV